MKTKIPGRSPSGNSFLTRSRRDLGVIGIRGGIPVKTKIPGGSPGGIYGGIFFLTESQRENIRFGKIPVGSQGNRDSWRDPGEGEDSRRDLWRDFFPDGILTGKYPGWQDPGGISAGIGILGGIPPRSRWLFYKGWSNLNEESIQQFRNFCLTIRFLSLVLYFIYHCFI